MPGTFASNRLAELAPILNGPSGQEFAEAMGQAQDAEMPLLRVAALSRLPYVCPDDALDGVGAWLKIERFTGEANGAAPLGDQRASGYRGRLCQGWDTWAIAASASAIEASLRAFGISNVLVLEDHEGRFWPGEWYSRFRVVIGPFVEDDAGALPAEIDLSCVIDQSLIGSTYTSATRAQIVRQVLKWKSDHSYFVDIVIRFTELAALIDIDCAIDASTIAANDDAFSTRWQVGPLLDVDFVIGANTIGGYVIQ